MLKRLSLIWAVVKGDARLMWLALRHPQSPTWLKFAVGGLALYLLSPVDLIPDWLPIIGVVDDLVLIPLAIGWLYRQLPESLRADVERRAQAAA